MKYLLYAYKLKNVLLILSLISP